MRGLLIAAVTATAFCAASMGQILAPVPPAPKPLPEYTPPPPPPAQPAQPAQAQAGATNPGTAPAQVAAPNLVERDAEGRVVLLKEVPEFLAVRKLSIPAERQPAVAAFMSQRAAAVEKAVAEHATKAIELREKLAVIDTLEINGLTNLPALFKPLSPGSNALEALRGSNALRPEEFEAVNTAVNEYRKALGEDVKKLAAGDIGKTMVLAASTQVRTLSIEPMSALDRMAGGAVSNWDAASKLLAGWEGTEKLTSAINGAGSKEAKINALLQAIKDMPGDKASALLISFGSPVVGG
jgi:hypothetical protein